MLDGGGQQVYDSNGNAVYRDESGNRVTRSGYMVDDSGDPITDENGNRQVVRPDGNRVSVDVSGRIVDAQGEYIRDDNGQGIFVASDGMLRNGDGEVVNSRGETILTVGAAENNPLSGSNPIEGALGTIVEGQRPLEQTPFEDIQSDLYGNLLNGNGQLLTSDGYLRLDPAGNPLTVDDYGYAVATDSAGRKYLVENNGLPMMENGQVVFSQVGTLTEPKVEASGAGDTNPTEPDVRNSSVPDVANQGEMKGDESVSAEAVPEAGNPEYENLRETLVKSLGIKVAQNVLDHFAPGSGEIVEPAVEAGTPAIEGNSEKVAEKGVEYLTGQGVERVLLGMGVSEGMAGTLAAPIMAFFHSPELNRGEDAVVDE